MKAATIMVAVPTETLDLTLCECGCGEPVNPLLDKVRAMRDGDRLPMAVVAGELGVSREYVRQLLRNPPRFKKGHAAKATQWIEVVCRAHQQPPSGDRS